MAGSGSEAPAALRHRVRAVHRVTGKQAASVVVRPDRPDIIVMDPLIGVALVTADEAVAIGLCLCVAAQGIARVDPDDLVVEADHGHGWKPLPVDSDR
jgi:hypothetical protein